MAKATKPKKERSKQYEEKLQVKGSFLQLMQAAVKNAKDKNAKKG